MAAIVWAIRLPLPAQLDQLLGGRGTLFELFQVQKCAEVYGGPLETLNCAPCRVVLHHPARPTLLLPTSQAIMGCISSKADSAVSLPPLPLALRVRRLSSMSVAIGCSVTDLLRAGGRRPVVAAGNTFDCAISALPPHPAVAHAAPLNLGPLHNLAPAAKLLGRAASPPCLRAPPPCAPSLHSPVFGFFGLQFYARLPRGEGEGIKRKKIIIKKISVCQVNPHRRTLVHKPDNADGGQERGGRGQEQRQTRGGHQEREWHHERQFLPAEAWIST